MYLNSGSGAGVATVRTGSVDGFQLLLALLFQMKPSWSAGSKDAAVKEPAGHPSLCKSYEKGQIAECEFAGEGLAVNLSGKAGPAGVGPAVHPTCCTSRYCHFHL